MGNIIQFRLKQFNEKVTRNQDFAEEEVKELVALLQNYFKQLKKEGVNDISYYDETEEIKRFAEILGDAVLSLKDEINKLEVASHLGRRKAVFLNVIPLRRIEDPEEEIQELKDKRNRIAALFASLQKELEKFGI